MIEFKLLKKCYIAYKAGTSTAFATVAAGIVARLVHISTLCLRSFNAVKGKGSCLPHTPYSSEFYGDVLHEGITS